MQYKIASFFVTLHHLYAIMSLFNVPEVISRPEWATQGESNTRFVNDVPVDSGLVLDIEERKIPMKYKHESMKYKLNLTADTQI